MRSLSLFSIKFGSLCLTVIAGGFSLPALARSEFGVVDMQQVILSVPEGKKARESLEKEAKAKDVEFGKQSQELDQMKKSLEEQGALLSEEARIKKGKEFEEKFMQLRKSQMAFQQQLKEKEQEATQAIAVKAAKITEELSKEQKLKITFEARSAGIIYMEDPVDLTNKVIANYEKKAPDSAGKSAKK